MTELKPCPFCNGYAAIERFGTALTSTQYTCQHCGAFLETGEEFNHGNVWNTRPREAELDAEIADLRAKLAAYEGQITAEEMRERCADVADTCDSPYGCATQEQDYACSDMAYRIAAAIRALSTKREEEYELVCVNGHDCCWAGPFDNCPYCERRTPYTKREEG